MRVAAGDRVYVSSSALRGKTVPALVDECLALGLCRFELTSSLPPHARMAEQLREATRSGLQVLLHNYAPPPADPFVINLASPQPDIRRRSIDHVRTALVLSAELGAPLYSVHAGFVTDPLPSSLGGGFPLPEARTTTDALRVFYDAVAGLCDAAESAGVDVLVENNVVTRANAPDGRNRIFLGVTPGEFEALLDAVRSPRLGLLLDVAHLKVSAASLGFDAVSALQTFRPMVRALHLSDNDGSCDSNEPFGEDAWFVPHLASFPDAIVSIETRPLEATDLQHCLALVESAR